jgi:hypothetical protein
MFFFRETLEWDRRGLWRGEKKREGEVKEQKQKKET